MNIIAGTGHRPDKLGGYSTVVAAQLQKLAEAELFKLKPNVVITGMALGWDQALGWAARAQRIPFWAYIPFEGQESVWPASSQERYRDLLSYAEKIVVCSPGGYATHKMQIRNMRMVDDATDILALWDGSAGGTANCLAYARRKQRPIHNCWQAWRSA